MKKVLHNLPGNKQRSVSFDKLPDDFDATEYERRWTGEHGEERPVKITMQVYDVGIHFHVSIDEERNMLLLPNGLTSDNGDPDEMIWTRFWSTPPGLDFDLGYYTAETFGRHEEAVDYILEKVKKNFSDHTHVFKMRGTYYETIDELEEYLTGD